jgi:uncharacterized protein (TIGR02452 family)
MRRLPKRQPAATGADASGAKESFAVRITTPAGWPGGPTPVLRFRPDADPARAALVLRAQLQLDRRLATQLAAQTVEILEAGSYRTRVGVQVSIAEPVSAAVARARTIGADEVLPPVPPASFPTTTVRVRNTTSLAAAWGLAQSGRAPLVLNLANGITPGGGFRTGSRAQEEYLCRGTALYPTLVGQRMYADHRARSDYESSDAAILSPDVPVFRDDDAELLGEPWRCHIVSMAAPVAHRVGQPRSAQLMVGRIHRLLHLAVSFGARDLVLGAWGCGAFGNDSRATADAFATALSGPFLGRFDQVVFAISDWSEERSHLGPFRDRFAALPS